MEPMTTVPSVFCPFSEIMYPGTLSPFFANALNDKRIENSVRRDRLVIFIVWIWLSGGGF
jgi:hypothetical protein